jgi:hypothetical protein
MDSGNLAIVMSAVFVRSDNAKEDALMCRAQAGKPSTSSSPVQDPQTLAGILKIAIDNYQILFHDFLEAQSAESPVQRQSPKLEGHNKVSTKAVTLQDWS